LLTAEHLKLSRKKAGLAIVPRAGLVRERAAELLTELLALAHASHGDARAALMEAFDDVVVDSKEEKALRAAKKLVLDRLEFTEREDVDAVAVRAAVFGRAAAARRAGAFDRAAVVAAAANDLGVAAAVVDEALYADLEDAHIVDCAGLPKDGTLLLDAWEEREVQALLLRAGTVVVDVDASAAELRALVRALKLHQLLFRVETVPDGHESAGLLRLVIDGPMGLFSSSTKVGLKLALLWPHIRACRRYRVAAQVQVKKGGRAEAFVVAGIGSGAVDAVTVSPVVRGLLDELPAHLPDCLVAMATELVAVDGYGAIAPDVVVVDAAGHKAFVEVLGFWSRAAVWKRVELVEGGRLASPMVFCFSDRLRVSEDALVDDHAALVAFKGALSAKRVAEKLKAVLSERPSPKA
jgi:predicted nuclease of restriction endonuclease-like RecB superfamily